MSGYEPPVDRFRGRLFMLARDVEQYTNENAYDAGDRETALDWLDLQRLGLELVGTVHRYVQAGEDEARWRDALAAFAAEAGKGVTGDAA